MPDVATELTGLLTGLLPPGAAAAAGDPLELAAQPLLPAEAAALGPVAPGRLREHTAGRACARAALRSLRLPPVPLPIGVDRAPRWPEGVIGSITHCVGCAAAAVAPRTACPALGIDAEPLRALPPGVSGKVVRPEEALRLRACGLLAPGVPWECVLFSVKESIYKAWSPLTGRWLGFADASVELDVRTRTFRARLLVPGPEAGERPPRELVGGFALAGGLVLSVAQLPPGRNG